MAFAKGRAGYITVGGNTVIQTQDWELNVGPDLEDVTSHGDTFHKRESTIMDWTATVNLKIDWSDTAQADLKTAILAGTTIVLRLYESASHYWYGDSYANTRQSVGVAAINAGTLTLTGNGVLAYS